jgi:hypothetical protein
MSVPPPFAAAALMMLAALGGCVDLTQPPQLLQQWDASAVDEDAAAGSGGMSGLGGSGGTGPATGPDGGPEAGARRDGAVVDAAGGTGGMAQADAAAGADVASVEAGATVVDASDVADIVADAPLDLGAVDAPPSPADGMADLVDAPLPPPTIAFTDATSFIYAPGTGGTDFTAPCGGGSQALIGVVGTSGGVTGLNSVQGTCGVVEATGALYQLTTRPSATLGPFGPVKPTMRDGSCPANQVVVGFDGASGSWLNYLYVYCASLTISGSAGSYTVTVGAATKLSTRLGTDGGTPFAADYCPAGQIAVGMLGAAGSAIDRFGLHCAKPVAQ